MFDKIKHDKGFQNTTQKEIKTWYILIFLSVSKNIIKIPVLATNPVFSRLSRVTTLYDKRKSD